MKLEHHFTIPVPVDTVWRALLDPERVAPCFPGATVTSASGEEFTGTVKVKLGPISLQYKGRGRFVETDEAAHRTVIEASGAAAGGQSAASTTVTATLAESGEGTAVTVATQLSITGKPAQFGRGLLEDVGKKIISQFADCLATTLGAADQSAPTSPQDAPTSPDASTSADVAPASSAEVAAGSDDAPAGPAARPSPGPSARPASRAQAPSRSTPQPVPAAAEIDLLDTAGPVVAKRVVPAIGVLVLLLLILRWLRHR